MKNKIVDLKYDKKKAINQHRKIAKRKMFLVIVLAVAIICAVIVVAIKEYNRAEKTSFEDYTFYRYLVGSRNEYDGTLELSKTGATIGFNSDGTKIESSSPFFFENEGAKVLFPEAMEVVSLFENQQLYKTNSLAEIENIDERTIISDGGKEKELNFGFLYDGNDLYFFPQETIVVIDGERRNLSAFSYVIANNGGNFEIYDYGKDEFLIIDTYSKASIEFNGCAIDLVSDSYRYGNDWGILVGDFQGFLNYTD